MKSLKKFFMALLEGIQDAKKYKNDPISYDKKQKSVL
jgi:hypothetical protein